MRSAISTFLVHATAASAAITFTVNKSANPSADELDAYTRIEAAMNAAVARHARFSDISKVLTVNYSPGTPTADANYNGNLNFGTNRGFMQERTALHEIAHALGVGQTSEFDDNCANGKWTSATKLLQSFDGAGAGISCGGGHFWPYGLNYDNEWSETNGDRHVQMILAMVADGMQGPGVVVPGPKVARTSAATTAAPTTTVRPVTTTVAPVTTTTTAEPTEEPTTTAEPSTTIPTVPSNYPTVTAAPTGAPNNGTASNPTGTSTRRRRPRPTGRRGRGRRPRPSGAGRPGRNY